MKRISLRAPAPVHPGFWGGFLGQLWKKLKRKLTPRIVREYAEEVKKLRDQQGNSSRKEEEEWFNLLKKFERGLELEDNEIAFVFNQGEIAGSPLEDFLREMSIQPTAPSPEAPETPEVPKDVVVSAKRLSYRCNKL